MADTDKKSDDEQSDTISNLLFKSRNILITGGIDYKSARVAVAQLLTLAEESDDPINVFISSPGGHVESGDMVHDIIKFIKPDVRTIGSGWVASAGALIFVGARLENRFCLPNTRFLLHQPSGGVGGTAEDVAIQARQISLMRERFEHLFAEATGQSPERIKQDIRRDFWLNTQEAVDYGLLNRVITSADELTT